MVGFFDILLMCLLIIAGHHGSLPSAELDYRCSFRGWRRGAYRGLRKTSQKSRTCAQCDVIMVSKYIFSHDVSQGAQIRQWWLLPWRVMPRARVATRPDFPLGYERQACLSYVCHGMSLLLTKFCSSTELVRPPRFALMMFSVRAVAIHDVSQASGQ